MADRKLRLKSLIARNISEILARDLKNAGIGFASVNDVDVNDDLSLAKVYVSFLGARYPRQNLQELEKVKGVVRSLLSKRMDVYKVPEIRFILDEQFDKALSLEEALKREEEQLTKK